MVFFNLKKHDVHLIIEELGKFNFELNVIPNRSEKYMSFRLDSKFVFIYSFQFSSSWWYSLVKNLGESYFKHFTQEFDDEVLDLFKQKGFYPNVYIYIYIYIYITT